MPLVTTKPISMSNGDLVTEFVDSVGTTETTYTFPSEQNYLMVKNAGNKTVVLRLNAQEYTINPQEIKEVSDTFTTFTAKSNQFTQQINIMAIKGFREDVVKIVNVFASSVKDAVVKEPTELHVGTNQTYKTIGEAIRVWETRFNKQNVSIKVHPGKYKENIRLVEGDISIIGYDRDNTIIYSDQGAYGNEPVYIGGGNVYVEKVTMIAEKAEHTGDGCYGLHIDRSESAGKTYNPSRIEIYDCNIVSHNHSGIGSGTENDQHIIIRDCYVYSSVNAGLLYHTSLVDYNNQKFSVVNCRVVSETYVPIYFKNVTPNQMGFEFELINNNLTSKSSQYIGESGLVNEGNKPIRLSVNNFGNNINSLNTPGGSTTVTNLDNHFNGPFKVNGSGGNANTPTANYYVGESISYYGDGRYTVQYAWDMFGSFLKYKRYRTSAWSAWELVTENYSYATASRPTAGLKRGVMIFDSTLGKPIWYNGSTWVDATGQVV